MKALTEWKGGVESLISEMKRRCGARTDTDLAHVIGTTQSNVSTWRKRERVPNSVLLKFEELDTKDWSRSSSYIAARIVAMRVAEHAFEASQNAGSQGSRYIFYAMIATIFPHLVEVLASDVSKRELATGRVASDIAQDLIENQDYLDHIWHWLKNHSAEEILNTKKLPQ